MRPGAVEPADLLRAQLWCRACEEFCFESDAESIAEFFREHLPHCAAPAAAGAQGP